METIKLKINGIEVTAPKGSTILEAARLAHIEIPTLCFLKEINEIGACRICVVESWLLPAYILRKTEWKYLPILQRSWIPEKRPSSFYYPTITAPACPAYAADTASFRSWHESLA